MSTLKDKSASESKVRLLPSSVANYEEDVVLEADKGRSFKRIYALLAGLCLSLVMNVGLIVQITYEAGVSNSQNTAPTGAMHNQLSLYSPANDAIEYRLTKFASSVDNGETQYQGRPSEKTNKAWQKLYKHMFTHVTEEEARLLPNKTAPEPPSDGSGYLVVLNVFHDLHCMDNIRKGLYYFLEPQWNGTNNPYVLYESPEAALQDRGGDHLSVMHLDHCIDSLRQSIQCTGDVVPNVCQYSPEHGDVRARSTVVHECRKFDKIQEWAAEHHVPGPFQRFGDGPELGKCGINDPWTCLYQ